MALRPMALLPVSLALIVCGTATTCRAIAEERKLRAQQQQNHPTTLNALPTDELLDNVNEALDREMNILASGQFRDAFEDRKGVSDNSRFQGGGLEGVEGLSLDVTRKKLHTRPPTPRVKTTFQCHGSDRKIEQGDLEGCVPQNWNDNLKPAPTCIPGPENEEETACCMPLKRPGNLPTLPALRMKVCLDKFRTPKHRYTTPRSKCASPGTNGCMQYSHGEEAIFVCCEPNDGSEFVDIQCPDPDKLFYKVPAALKLGEDKLTCDGDERSHIIETFKNLEKDLEAVQVLCNSYEWGNNPGKKGTSRISNDDYQAQIDAIVGAEPRVDKYCKSSCNNCDCAEVEDSEGVKSCKDPDRGCLDFQNINFRNRENSHLGKRYHRLRVKDYSVCKNFLWLMCAAAGTLPGQSPGNQNIFLVTVPGEWSERFMRHSFNAGGEYSRGAITVHELCTLKHVCSNWEQDGPKCPHLMEDVNHLPTCQGGPPATDFKCALDTGRLADLERRGRVTR